jgi:hypothetical protein
VELGSEPFLGGERRSDAAELDREVDQASAEGRSREPAVLSLGLAQYALEVAEEGYEEEHRDQLQNDDDLGVAALSYPTNLIRRPGASSTC